MSASNFARSNIVITILSLVSVGLNFVSQMVIAYFFGAKDERDAYFSAISIPTYITALFIGSVTVIFLPYFVDFRKKNDQAKVTSLVMSAFISYFLILTFIVVISFIFSDKIVEILTPGFNTGKVALTQHLYVILIFSVVFQSLSSFLSVFHHVENRFLWPAIGPLAIPVCCLIFVCAFSQHGIQSLAYGMLAGSIISMFIISRLFLQHVKGFKTFFHASTINLFKLSLPLVAAGAIYRLTTVIERVIASRLPSGSISYLGYSNQLYLLLATIASGSIATTFYPAMSTAWTEGNRSEWNVLLNRGIRLILIITFPIAALFIVLGNPIIHILLQRGAFNAETTAAVSLSLSLLMGAFIFGSLGNLLVKVFYITNKTITISIVCVLEVLIYLGAGYILSFYFSYLGLALALTISTGFTIIASLFFLLKWKHLIVSDLHIDFIKLSVATCACGAISFFTYSFAFTPSLLINTGLSVLTGMLIYLVMILCVLKINDAAAINKFIRNIWHKRSL